MMMSSSISTINNNNNRKRNYVYGDIIDFDVGGRIFRVRRSLIDSFPSTMLARSAAQVWNANNNNDLQNNSNNDTSSTNTMSEEALNRSVDDDMKHSKRSKYDVDADNAIIDHDDDEKNPAVTKVVNHSDTINRKPIFIDRDSHRFSYVLDYMRDGGIIELPVTISKDSFIKDLIYYGFDNIIIDNITISVPTYEAVLHIESLHTQYQERILSIELEKDYVELSYTIFKQFVDKRNTTIVFRTNTDGQNICKIAQLLAREYSSMVHCQHHHSRDFYHDEERQSNKSIHNEDSKSGDISHTTSNNRDVINITNVNQSSDQLHNNNNNKISSPSSKFILFNKCLREYGLQCNTIDYESGCSVTMKIASYDKSNIIY